MRELLRRRDVRLLLVGQTLSMFGDWAMFFVLAIWAKVLTGSNAAAGLVFFVLALAGLAAPLGGLVVDRLPKRRLMIVTHLAMAAMVCMLLFVNDRSDLWLIYVVAALYGLGGDLFAAARSAMLKAMLPDELLARGERDPPVAARGAAARRAARRRRDLRRVRRRRGRARRRGKLRALRRDARAASLRRAGRRRARAVPARGLGGSAAHRADARAARADDRRVRRDARRRVQRDDHLRADRRRPAPAAVVHRRDRELPGGRRDRRRADRADADAAPRRRPSRRARSRAVRRRRRALAPPPPAGRDSRDGDRRRRNRVGGRGAGDVVPAAQPDGGSGPRQRGREHALQRAADDLDRDRRGADHGDRLPRADRDDGGGVRARVRVSPHAPRGGVSSAITPAASPEAAG